MDSLSYEHAPMRRRRRRMLVAMLLASSLATVGAGAMSLAVFTDSKAATGAWTTGSIILGVTPTTTFGASSMMPGDTGTQIIGVTNNGTSQLRYSMSSVVTESDGKGLAAQMTLLVTDGPVLGGVCTGNTVYTGSLAGAAFGSSTAGAQAGDRNVNAGVTQNLCFGWSFPLGSGNGYQTAATSSLFTFAAEQTANNP